MTSATRRFHAALNSQPLWTPLLHPLVPQIANVLFVVANVLVLTSMARLGVTGTYLGDYFGILMKKRVTGFPFNVTENPMYNGATLNFLSLALWWGCGCTLTLWAPRSSDEIKLRNAEAVSQARLGRGPGAHRRRLCDLPGRAPV